MRACAKIAGIFLVLIAALASCDIFGVKLDNPADPNSPNYQGYTNVDHVNLVVPMAPSGDLTYPPTLYASKVIGGSAYRFQISANESFNVIETEVEQATNVFSPSTWVPSLGAGNYHFRVQAKKDGTWGPWSRSQVFTLQSKGTVATPAFSLTAGNYGSTQSVTLSCATSGALIRYTTDGSNPSVTAGTLYSAPVQVATSLTLKAVAYIPGWTTSQIASAAYSVNGAALPPAFSPGPGSYTSGRNVTISSDTAGASIRYTTDGSTPSETAGTLYASPVAINSSTTLKAIAYKEGWLPSTVTSGAYVITGTVASPVISPNGGSFTAAQQVSITSSLDGASIRYTLDGSNPSSTMGILYTGAFTLSASATVKVVAYKADWLDSAIASASFTITGTVASPTFSPAAGTYTSAQSVTIATNPSDATIRYTLDGSTPSETTGTVYTGAIQVSSTKTIKAIAYKQGWTQSSVSSSYYALSVPRPLITPSGGTYTTQQYVGITNSLGGASIRYTLDGSNPSTTQGILYTGAFTVSASLTVKAVAYKDDWLASEAASENYLITGTVATPTFSKVSGTYTAETFYGAGGVSSGVAWQGISLVIDSATSGAEIYYTLDGSIPDKVNGIRYPGSSGYDFLKLTSSAIVKAIAYKTDWATSDVTTANYTITGTVLPVRTSHLYSSTVPPGTKISLYTPTTDVEIYYTIDGTIPSKTNGFKYVNEITIISNTTFKTIAFKEGWNPSSVTEWTYTVQ